MKEFLSISLIALLIVTAFGTYLVATPAHAKASSSHSSSSKTVKVNCRNVAVALATLNIAVALADKDSLDGSLNEGNIAPDLQSERHLLLDLTQQIVPNIRRFTTLNSCSELEWPLRQSMRGNSKSFSACAIDPDGCILINEKNIRLTVIQD